MYKALSFGKLCKFDWHHHHHLSTQRGVYGVLWAEGPEGVFSAASAALPHSLHWRAWLLQRHRDIYHLGWWEHGYRLGQGQCKAPKQAGQPGDGGQIHNSPFFPWRHVTTTSLHHRQQRWTLMSDDTLSTHTLY